MSFLILARHGETEINVLNKRRKIYYGRQESPLTDLGRAQAYLLGVDIAFREGVHVDLALTSPLSRTVETTRIALSRLPDLPPVLVSDRITARSLGQFEGITRDELELRHPAYVRDPRFNKFDAHFTQRAPGGENLSDVTARAWEAVEWAEGRTAGDVLLVTHATVVRCLLGKALGLPREQVSDLKIPNAAPVYLSRNAGRHELAFASLERAPVEGEGDRTVLRPDDIRSRMPA